MKDRIIDAYNNIAPTRSDDEIIDAIIGKARPMEKKRFNKKALIIPAAAVMALTIGTVGVGAAYNWNYAELLDSFFATRMSDNDVESNSGFDFDKYGMALNKTVKKDGCTLDIKGVVADRNTAYIIADVTVDELAEGTLDLKDVYLLGYIYAEQFGNNFSAESACLERNGNIFTMMCPISIADDQEFPDEIVTFTLSNFTYFPIGDDGEYTTHSFEIYEDIEVDMSCFDRSMAYKVIKPDAPFIHTSNNGSTVNAILNEIRISPLSVGYSIGVSPEEIQKIYEYHDLTDGAILTFADGSTMDFNSSAMVYAENTEQFECKHFLRYPIDPENVASVTIAGITYDIK